MNSASTALTIGLDVRTAAKTLMVGILALLLGLVIGVAAVAVSGGLPQLGIFGVNHQTSTREVINSVETDKEVVLLRLGIQGISEAHANGQVLGVDIPGADRATFLQYGFTASLGIDGKDVTITRAGAKKYKLNIPTFVFIGHDDVEFKLVAQDNGVLSAVTPKVDTVQMINAILDDGAKAQYVDKHREALEAQAKDFYAGIIKAVEPDAEVVFDFSN